MPDEGYTVSPDILTTLGGGDIKAGQRALRLILDTECAHVPVNGPTPRQENVRIATEADEDQILALLRLDHAENAAHIAPFSEQKTRSFIEAATRDKVSTIAVIDGPEGIVGLTCYQPEQWFFSEDWFVAERVTFVSPRHRTSRHGADLIRHLRFVVDDMARQLGSPVYLIGQVIATRDARRKSAMFGRLLNFAGSVYVYPDPAPPSLS